MYAPLALVENEMRKKYMSASKQGDKKDMFLAEKVMYFNNQVLCISTYKCSAQNELDTLQIKKRKKKKKKL